MMIDELIRSARKKFDLTENGHQESVKNLAEKLLEEGDGIDVALEKASDANAPLEARMAALLADSRNWMMANRERSNKVAVVYAMWGEQNRLLPKSTGNPTGENSLATKLEQLDWVTRGTAIDWHLYAVDDGCPHRSGVIAQELVDGHPLGNRATILSLSDALPTGDGPLRNLASADDSRKAGAVILGCVKALEAGADAIVYTDADNSVHLGQLGLLLRPFFEENVPVVLGDRKQPGSVLVKEAARWGIGIKVLRHMQRMIGRVIFSRGIMDTQAAFKLYQNDLLREIIADPTVFDFSFDTDWILGAISREVKIVQVPFAFIDSAAESASITQGPMTTWETLLFGLARSVRRYGYAEGDAAAMIEVLEEEIAGSADLDLIIDRLPNELETAGEADFGNPEVMSPEEMRVWLRAVPGRNH